MMDKMLHMNKRNDDFVFFEILENNLRFNFMFTFMQKQKNWEHYVLIR